jgi:hypothetical protein
MRFASVGATHARQGTYSTHTWYKFLAQVSSGNAFVEGRIGGHLTEGRMELGVYCMYITSIVGSDHLP